MPRSLNGVVEAGAIELAQTAFKVLLGKRLSLLLGQMTGKWLQQGCGNTFECYAANAQPLHCENRLGRLIGIARQI